MKLIASYLVVLSLFSSNVFSQSKKEDTLTIIRKLINEKQYTKAKNLLVNYELSHTDDLETNWLYAQVLHWTNNTDLSEQKFKKAITLSPKNTAIQLDYARMLYESGRFKKALILLTKLKEIDETKAEALLMEANIYFWNGNLTEAKKIITKIQTIFPEAKITNSLSKNISETSSPYLKTTFEYQSDNQPLKFVSEKVEFGQYHSWLLNPKLEISNYNFNSNKQATFGTFSNEFYFSSIGLFTSISGGLYKNFSNNSDWIGDINFKFKRIKNTTIKLGYNKKPYFGTLVSSTYNLTQNNIFGELDYENNKLFSVHIGYNNQNFNDNNIIQSFSSWALSKPYKLADLTIQFGYGFSYSDAKANLYTSKQTLTEVLSNFNPNTSLEGYYNPYFTPKSQMINAALVLLDYKPTKQFDFAIKANYGFAAKCQNPFAYIDADTQGNSILTTNFSPTTFNPYEISGTFIYSISSKFQAKITYTHQETFFYNRNNTNLGLNYKF